jgi:hypothetical protein
MITGEAALVLKAYTTLGTSVQGALLKRARGYELGGAIERGAKLGAQAAQAPVVCVKKATIHAGFMDAGRIREGPLVLQGQSVPLEGSRVALAGHILGSKAPEAVLASFGAGDVLSCSGYDEIPFGTVSTAGPLVPPWEYVQALLEGRAQRALVACAGGCFLFDRLRVVPLDRAQQLFENLCNLDIVLVAPGQSLVAYRLASNAIALGPADFEDTLAELQAALRVPPSARSKERLPSTSELQMSASMADTNMMSGAFAVSQQQVRDVAPAPYRILAQPLVQWQLPMRRLEVDVALSSASARAQRLRIRPWLAHALHMGVDAVVTAPPFVPARPGDSQQTQKEQLSRILREAVGARLPRVTFTDDAALALFAREVTKGLNAAFNSAGLFAGPVTTRLRASLETTRGAPVTLPSGGLAVVPEYATQTSSARMCAFVGPLIAAGLRVSYTPWARARHGIPVA